MVSDYSQPVKQVVITLALLQAASRSFPSPLNVKSSWALHIGGFPSNESIHPGVRDKGDIFGMVLRRPKFSPREVSCGKDFVWGILNRNADNGVFNLHQLTASCNKYTAGKSKHRRLDGVIASKLGGRRNSQEFFRLLEKKMENWRL